MEFLILLVIAIAFSLGLSKPIKKFQWIFYLIAIALSVIYIANKLAGVPPFSSLARQFMYLTIQKGSLGVALFVVVMYIGVFDGSTWVRRRLGPIRGELSIIAWLLVVGHVVVYAVNYLPKAFGGVSFKANVMTSVTFGAILTVLLIVLGVTSIGAVRRAMKGKSWKKVQVWAYLFYALMYVHLVAILMPSAINGAPVARVSVIVYTVIFGIYLVLRVRKALRDRKKADARAADVEADAGQVASIGKAQ